VLLECYINTRKSTRTLVYTHSVKIEDTAKGIRLSAHVYTNYKQIAINEAITTYLETKLKAEKGLRNSTR
jgi:predicted DNA-binding ribbon-helix-helix protein